MTLPNQAECNEAFFARSRQEWAELGGFPSAEKGYNAKARPLAVGTEQHVAPLKIRSGFDILKDPIPARWLLRPYLEEAVLALLYGNLGTLKSFIALHWSLQLAQRNVPVLYFSAEGKGLERRMRGWCARYAAGKTPEDAMLSMPFYAIERPLELSQSQVLDAVDAGIKENIPPKLIVVDTLARYAGALDENKAQDMNVLIGAADRLRLDYGATILLVHHTGHSAKDRARGSYALMAATDAHFLVERPNLQELLVTVTTGRLKDSESPPPFSLRGEVIPLGYLDEDKQPVTTLVLQPTTEIALPTRREPTGRNVQEALGALRALPSTEFTMREAQEAIRPTIPDRRRRSEAVVWLQKNKYLVPTVGGLRLEA